MSNSSKSETPDTSDSGQDTKMTKYFGAFLILLSIAGFIATTILSITDLEKVTNGTIPALSFLVLIIGLIFYFPSLLEESTGVISTMRIIVLIVVLVFALVYIKLGWVAGSFSEFVIDTSWIYILGLAFGSKAFQRFAENDDNT
ncbi:MAG: hypothetical protein HYR67_06800 [Bacteroidetes bacterium]|nr:hypothetical protein [Bacteroidota bacterium]